MINNTHRLDFDTERRQQIDHVTHWPFSKAIAAIDDNVAIDEGRDRKHETCWRSTVAEIYTGLRRNERMPPPHRHLGSVPFDRYTKRFHRGEQRVGVITSQQT